MIGSGCRGCNGNKPVETRTPRSAAGRRQSLPSGLDACGAVSDRSYRRSFRNGPRVCVPWRSTARPTSHRLAMPESQRTTRRGSWPWRRDDELVGVPSVLDWLRCWVGAAQHIHHHAGLARGSRCGRSSEERLRCPPSRTEHHHDATQFDPKCHPSARTQH